jgi:CSLREA domain-containing protein/uncharacterized repeat protein (TIGR01451 family)
VLALGSAGSAWAVPHTYTVNSTADEPDTTPGDNVCSSNPSGVCTLRAAIEETNGNANATDTDTINVPGNTYNLSGSGLTVTQNVVVQRTSGTVIVDAQGNGTVFTVNDSSNDTKLTLIQLTVQGGSEVSGGGVRVGTSGTHVATADLQQVVVRNNSAVFGGGIDVIDSEDRLTVNNSTIDSNHADNFFPCGCSPGGGGIWNGGGATVTNSTISRNTAVGGQVGGGILHFAGFFNLTNSTVSANEASIAGGIEDSSGTMALSFVTVAFNTEDSGGTAAGGLHADTSGTTSKASIFSNNTSVSTSSDQCGGSAVSSQGYNLSSDSSCVFSGGTGDQTNANAALGGLGFNGGPTETHAIGTSGTAVDRVPTATCTVGSDQRGFGRPPASSTAGSLCDVGAYELQTGSGGSIGTGTGTGTGTTTVPPGTGADLRMDATPPDPVFVGDQLTFEFTIINDGPEQANSVYLIDQLPTQAAVQRARLRVSRGGQTLRVDQSSCTGASTLTCPLGDLPARSVVTVTITVRAVRAGRLQNIAGVSAFATSTPSDPNPANNLTNTVTDVLGRAVSAAFATSLATIQNPFAQGGVIVRVRPRTTETILATATSTIPGAARRFRLYSARRTLRAGRTGTLKLRLPPAYRRALRRALARNRRIFATLRLTGRTTTGRTYRTTRRVRLID